VTEQSGKFVGILEPQLAEIPVGGLRQGVHQYPFGTAATLVDCCGIQVNLRIPDKVADSGYKPP
jgi:hypothetical protein